MTHNTSRGHCSSANDTCTLASSALIAQPCHSPLIPTSNFCAPIAFWEDDIAVNSGASEGFAGAKTQGIDRCVSDNGVIMASATGHLQASIGTNKCDLPLLDSAKECHVLPQGTIKQPLPLVGKACDAGLDAWFARGGEHAHFFNDGDCLLSVDRDPAAKLCLLPQQARTTDSLPNPQPPPIPPRPALNDINAQTTGTHACHNLDIQQPLGLGLAPQQAPRMATGFNACNHESSSVLGLVHRLHACAGFPKPDTWIKAINNGCFIGWPGLTVSRVRKHLGKHEMTAMGHPKSHRQGTRTTSKGANPTKTATEEGNEPTKTATERKTVHDLG